jgi:hypothetical protein
MNWEMLAAIGQMAAVVIGIPSLIYLAIQIREQTKERRNAAIRSLVASWDELMKSLNDSAEFAAIYLRGLQSFDALDSVSKVRFSVYLGRSLRNLEGMYFHRQEGILGDSLWAEMERILCDVLANPGTREWWATRRHWYTDDFAAMVDRIVAKGGQSKAYAGYDLSDIAKM